MNARELAKARYTWLTAQEFADAIRRSADTVKRMIRGTHKEWKIEGAILDGAGYLIPPPELDRYIEGHKVNAA